MADLPTDNSLVRPLLDAVALFRALNIRYALVGGLAAMHYGRARFTDDVDFVAAVGHREVLASHAEAMNAHHFAADCTWKLYHDSGLEVDIWKDEFSDGIAARAHEIPLAGAAVRIADVHDLIAMKLRAGRFQDDYDISEILKHTPIDQPTLAALITPPQLAHFEQIRARTAAAGA